MMLTSFEERPLILRLYGTGRSVREGDSEWDELLSKFNPVPGQRQIVVLDIESLQTSCGYAVPVMEFKEVRGKLNDWVETLDPKEIEEYWVTGNATSIDGLPTGTL